MFNASSGGIPMTGDMKEQFASTLQAALRDAAVTREVVVGRGAVRALADVAQRALPAGRWMVVADDTTWQVAGEAAQAQLEGRGIGTLTPMRLPARPRLKPRVELARQIAERLRSCDALPVAAGSGVVNDLVKYAAELAGKPYLCLATAASMDGYAASGAALLEDGFKRTLACAPPIAMLADLDVLAQAPARMNAWGYGDLAGKTVAGADWLLADALAVEAVNPRPFALVQDHLAGWLDAPERLAAREPDALGGLLSGLLVSGFAMQAHGNSRPASGSDHQFSHLWEMEGLQVDGEAAAHGACVGVGCVAMLALYEWLLARPDAVLAAVRADDFDDADALAREIAAGFDRPEVARAAHEEMKAKRALGSRRARVARFAAEWPVLRGRLARRLPDARAMQQRLRAAGGTGHPRELGIDAPRMAADYRRARLIRRRYTLLDLLEDLGWLDRAISDLFAPDGFWGLQASDIS
jgi:glycerol-1-phosphate dehydrogenase [NAD(P)+]